MANSSINLVNLDFAELRQSLLTYLKEQDLFKDYDFTGSNMSVLLDILSYNTYHNAFYLNMIGNEMFLDSALMRDSIISHAKELNYIPRSFKSAKAVVDIDVQANSSTTFIQIPKNTQFSSTVGANTYLFTTNKTLTNTTSNNNIFSFKDVEIYEGVYSVESFVLDTSQENQRFIIQNQLVDTDSITVVVSEDNTADVYEKKTSLLDLNETSKVFFVQACENDRYEILLGNGIIGYKPKNGATIIVEYRASSGELPNGAYDFQNTRSINGFSNVTVSTVYSASAGSIYETLESIKYNAPRHYTTQERAVTAFDYEILLQQQFPEINALAVYGGETVSPPVYGKVFIAADLIGFDGIPDYKKKEFASWLKNKTPLTIEAQFVDPQLVYGKVEAVIKYNANVTDLSPDDISSRVVSAIMTFNSSNYSKFNSKVRQSKLLKVVDDAHSSIVSSYVEILPYVKLKPTLGQISSYTIDFKVPINNNLPQLSNVFAANTERILSSGKFIFDGKVCELSDDNNGSVYIISLVGTNYKMIRKVGTIDYNLGRVVLNNINISSIVGGSSELKVYIYSEDSNFDFTQNVYFEIKEDDVVVSVEAVRE